MKMIMKIALLIMFISAWQQSALGGTYRIRNLTNFSLKGTIYYKGESKISCRPDKFEVGPSSWGGISGDMDAGLCESNRIHLVYGNGLVTWKFNANGGGDVTYDFTFKDTAYNAQLHEDCPHCAKIETYRGIPEWAPGFDRRIFDHPDGWVAQQCPYSTPISLAANGSVVCDNLPYGSYKETCSDCHAKIDAKNGDKTVFCNDCQSGPSYITLLKNAPRDAQLTNCGTLRAVSNCQQQKNPTWVRMPEDIALPPGSYKNICSKCWAKQDPVSKARLIFCGACRGVGASSIILTKNAPRDANLSVCGKLSAVGNCSDKAPTWAHPVTECFNEAECGLFTNFWDVPKVTGTLSNVGVQQTNLPK